MNREIFWKMPSTSCVLNSGHSAPVTRALTTWPQCLPTPNTKPKLHNCGIFGVILSCTKSPTSLPAHQQGFENRPDLIYEKNSMQPAFGNFMLLWPWINLHVCWGHCSYCQHRIYNTKSTTAYAQCIVNGIAGRLNGYRVWLKIERYWLQVQVMLSGYSENDFT